MAHHGESLTPLIARWVLPLRDLRGGSCSHLAAPLCACASAACWSWLSCPSMCPFTCRAPWSFTASPDQSFIVDIAHLQQQRMLEFGLRSVHVPGNSLSDVTLTANLDRAQDPSCFARDTEHNRTHFSIILGSAERWERHAPASTAMPPTMLLKTL